MALVCSTTHKLLHTSVSSCGCTKSTQHLPDVLVNRPSSPLSTLHQPLRRPLATCDAPPSHTNRHTHTLFLPHPSTIWIMHHQTVGSELMSQLLREPGETPVRCDGYTKRSPRSGCTQHQMSKVRGDELWVIPLAPPLQCHHIRRQEHVVWPMWLCIYVCVCVCVSVCLSVCLWERMKNHLYAHSMERWGSFNFDAFSQLRAREISLCNHGLCSVDTCAVGHLRKIQLSWWYNKKIQSASEHAKEGGYMYETCLRKQV